MLGSWSSLSSPQPQRPPPLPPISRPRSPMDATVPALDRVIEKYRHDVHHLAPPAAVDAIRGLERHLGQRLPGELAHFLSRHNGVTLFRGALRIRSTSDVAAALESSAGVLFADTDAVVWAWVGNGEGHVFGPCSNGSVTPMYGSFSAFLAGEIAALEAEEDAVDEARFAMAGGDLWQLLGAAQRALQEDDAVAAAQWLEHAQVSHPGEPMVWARLSETAAALDNGAEAQRCAIETVRRLSLPRPWPGAPMPAPSLFECVDVGDPGDWPEVLDAFLGSRVSDVTSEAEAAFLEAATLAQASLEAAAHGRDAAGGCLERLLVRARDCSNAWMPWQALLKLVDVRVALGRHDAAEALLRQIRRHGPEWLQGERLRRLLEIVVIRQEPWAEDVVRELAALDLSDGERRAVRLLTLERAIRLQKADDAERLLQPLLDEAPLDPEQRAAVAMSRADLAALRDDRRGAERAYLEALEALGDPPLHELALRVRLRLCDLYRRQGDLDAAHDLGVEVVEGFAALELPVREAWALVRLARVVQERDPGSPEAATRARQLRQAARQRFVDADLAAGVAATDSLEGAPGASLAWHLERSTAQARARHDAQRSRPPYTRADADRPERRLGAHRIAVAACDDGIVRALSQEMDACVRATRATAGRPTEPAVLRYVAAVDLLSAHRSYDAAQVLLEHLLQRGVEGVMARALQGAIARSPNAALVDGLLRFVEAPRQASPVSVAAAAELLGLRREEAALPPLVRLLGHSGATSARRAALVALGRIGDRSVVDALVPSLQDPRLAEPAALSLLMLGDRRGVDFHGRALMDGRNDLSGSPGEIVGRYGGPDHLLLLIRASQAEGPSALGALQGLGLLGDPRAVRALIRAMRAPSRRIVEVASGAMQILTGREEDATEPGVRGRWSTWWEQHGGQFPEGVRHRRGHVYDAGLLISDMTHADAYVRRTAYDELVIATGQSLPFDADGPWRVQGAHLRAWQDWWATSSLQPGRWYLDGEEVG